MIAEEKIEINETGKYSCKQNSTTCFFPAEFNDDKPEAQDVQEYREHLHPW